MGEDLQTVRRGFCRGKKIVNMEKKSGKKIYLEVLRCVALLCVIAVHVAAIPIQNWETNPGTWYFVYPVTYAVGCLGVPLFLMISGSLLLDPQKNISLEKLYKKMIPRILLPLLFFGYCFALMEIFFDTHTIKVSMFVEGLVHVLNKTSWEHLWYLYLLIGIYLLLPIIRVLLNKITDKQLEYLMGVLFFLAFVIPTVNKVLGTTISLEEPKPLCHITSFIMGYVVSRYHTSERFKKYLYLSGSVSFAILLIFELFAGKISYESYKMLVGYDCIFIFAVGSMIFLLFHDKKDAIEKIITIPGGKIILSLAECSFGIYLIHPVIMNILYKVMGWQPVMFNPVISIPAFCIAFIVPCHIAVWIMKKIPVIRRLV